MDLVWSQEGEVENFSVLVFNESWLNASIDIVTPAAYLTDLPDSGMMYNISVTAVSGDLESELQITQQRTGN